MRGRGSRLACWRPLEAHTPCEAACERWRHSNRTCTHTPPAGQKAQPWAASLKTSASSVENRLLTSPGGLSAESLVSDEGEGGGRCTDSQVVGRSAELGGRGPQSRARAECWGPRGALRRQSGGLHVGERSPRAAQRSRRSPPSAAPPSPSLSLHRKAPTRSK